jgi:hypothetical protein
MGLGFELGFALAKQALHHLSHISSPFCSGYFEDGGVNNYLPRLALNLSPPSLSLLAFGSAVNFVVHCVFKNASDHLGSRVHTHIHTHTHTHTHTNTHG